jgi:hypothetical protein
VTSNMLPSGSETFAMNLSGNSYLFCTYILILAQNNKNLNKLPHYVNIIYLVIFVAICQSKMYNSN